VPSKPKEKLSEQDRAALVEEYWRLGDREKEFSDARNRLKPSLAFVKLGQAFTCTIPEGTLVAKRIEQDRRQPDPDLLMAVLKKKGFKHATKRVPDMLLVDALVMEGKLTVEDIAPTLRGTRYDYPLVELKSGKD
jgi:hypothetical protein